MIIKDLYFLLFVLAIIFNIYHFKNKFYYVLLIFLFIAYIKDQQTILSNLSNKSEITLKDDTINRVLDKIIKENNNLYNTESLFSVYKVPKRFIFIKKNKYIQDIIFDLEFLEIFNKEEYYNTIILLDYFLKKYYKMINDEIDFQSNKSILFDLKKNILNSLHEQIYSTPTQLHSKITNNSNKLLKYMNNKIKILFDKNKVDRLSYPIEHNMFVNNIELY